VSKPPVSLSWQISYYLQQHGRTNDRTRRNTTARAQSRIRYVNAFASPMSVSLIAILQSSGVLNTDLSTAVASSSGPQRSNRGATRKGKEIGKNIGRRKRPPKTLPPDINWYRTCDRFYWEMIQTYLLQPSGGLPTPEAAYAKISQSIKEDLHQSVSSSFYCGHDRRLTDSLISRQPLMVRELGVRPIREQEQYLTSILDVLYPACEGKKRDVQGLLDQGERDTHLCT